MSSSQNAAGSLAGEKKIDKNPKKPRLSLHIGMAKAGSTSLQRYLAENHNTLLRKRVLFPMPLGKRNHIFLLFLLGKSAHTLRLRKLAHFMPGYMAFQFLLNWAIVKASMSRNDIDQVVLSSEYLFNRINGQNITRIAGFLHKRFDEISIYCYVREPASLYASRISQEVKYSDALPELDCNPYKRFIESWEKGFPGSVFVRIFPQSDIYNLDITSDFSNKCLGIVMPSATSTTQKIYNQSMSVEASAAMQYLRHQICPGYNGRHPLASYCYRSICRLQSGKPTKQASKAMLPSVKNAIEGHCTDLHWLKSNYGIIFPGIDYAAIGRLQPRSIRLTRVEDVFQVDAGCKKDLIHATLANAVIVRFWIKLRKLWKTRATSERLCSCNSKPEPW
jgi:hypothetical protein